MSAPIAYTYDADTHCQTCAEKRFGRVNGFIAGEGSLDSEGNAVGVIAPWDEWQSTLDECSWLECGTCHDLMDEYHINLYGDTCADGDDLDAHSFEGEPVIVRDTGGSVPRDTREWVEVMLGDAEAVGADKAKLDDIYQSFLSIHPEERVNELGGVEDDIEALINATGEYMSVMNGDMQVWSVYRRR